MSGMFARPEITLEDLERRLVQVMEGNDSVRADAELSATHSPQMYPWLHCVVAESAS